MKKSPLQIGKMSYTEVVIRAIPGLEADQVERELPIDVDAAVFYDVSGQHFATLSLTQRDESYAYTMEVTAFASFVMDAEGCSELYKAGFKPGNIGLNVVRVIYSSMRDLIAGITARSPWEVAQMPTLIIESSDIQINFEKDFRDQILRDEFAMSEKEIEDLRVLREKMAAKKQASVEAPAKVKKGRSTKKA